MPNYPLGTHYSESHVHQVMAGLCTLHNAMFEADFPLTTDEIADAIAPARVRHLLKELQEAGINSVQNSRDISAIVEDENIPRAAAVRFTLARPVLYCFEEQSHAFRYSTKFSEHSLDKLPFDLSSLCDESREKVIAWVNKAVWERRRTKLTRRTVSKFFNSYCDSNYMLHARWPALAMLFKGHHVWEARVRERPRNLNRWRWEKDPTALDWQIKNYKAIQVAEQMLIGASLISADIDTLRKAPVRCEIIDWRTINNEYL